jgi:hypothetical protein
LFLPANPFVVSEREDLVEVIEEGFDSALDPRDVRRFAYWIFEGENELGIYALEFRKPGLASVAARAFTRDDDDTVLEFVEGEQILVLVGGERRDAIFTRMLELVRERIE